ncbi:piggyBac transposable element-derived protein 4-like [Spodoptera litura]|uniref:PiggyBac transposable element-derived protein 4-like n=1 Tax=Spodoptera litura TaxID=69820 RepID=A0A9J7IV51_SPOLT|nr:piggyBac transposable element-derived protein 4-like [Spodoptera litura]XP_022829483.1 piggyBac transposable element-derived protein 4-like [Spodoptera litura]
MSIWRGNEHNPADFLELLYEEEDPEVRVNRVGEHDVLIDDENEFSYRRSLPEGRGQAGSFPGEDEPWDSSPERSPSPKASFYAPLSFPEPATRRPPRTGSSPRATASRERSRSPIFLNPPSQSVPEQQPVIRISGKSGLPLDAGTTTEVEDGMDVAATIEADVDTYLSPDAHALYVSLEESKMHDSERNARKSSEGRSGRGGRRRGVRGQNVGGRGHPNRGRRGNNQWEVGHPLNEIWTKDEDVPPELVSLAMDVLKRRQLIMQAAAKAERDSKSKADDENDNGDEFFDAIDGADSLRRLEGQNLHFEWSTMESFQGQEEIFRPQRTTGAVHVYNSAYDAFRSYWSDDILRLIVAETNLYANNLSAAFQSEWYPTNIHEILCLFSFWIMLGIVRMPTIISCFSVHPLMKTEVFRRIFTRKRYEMLIKALNFMHSDPTANNDPSNISAASSSDPLYCMRPIITYLNSSFQANYTLHKDICIDESLTLWNGKLHFRQYIQNKAARLGFKTFELCESTTGYIWSFIVDAGRAIELKQSPGVLKSTAFLQKLIGPLLNKGYRLFLDSRYNSPLLARFLKLNGTDCVGTLEPSSMDVPVVINKAPLKRGEFIARHSGDVSILSWQDNKRVTMISTCHGSATALPTVSSRPQCRAVPFKPQVVLDYNKFMGGVDMKDQILEPYLIERQHCAKHMKLFKRLLNVSILNARILVESSLQKRHNHLAFRLSLVDSILTNHLSLCPESRRFSSSTHQPPQTISRSAHWPVLLDQTESAVAANRNFRKRCVVCLRNKKAQKTPYCCDTCKVPLCIINCFKSYHISQY